MKLMQSILYCILSISITMYLFIIISLQQQDVKDALDISRRASRGMEILEAWEVREGGNGGVEGLGCRGGREWRF